MIVDTIKENLCVNKKIATKKEIIFVEGDVIVPDAKPDVINIICTSGVACIYKKDIIDILNLGEEIYKSKDDIIEILEYINVILLKLSKEESSLNLHKRYWTAWVKGLAVRIMNTGKDQGDRKGTEK